MILNIKTVLAILIALIIFYPIKLIVNVRKYQAYRQMQYLLKMHKMITFHAGAPGTRGEYLINKEYEDKVRSLEKNTNLVDLSGVVAIKIVNGNNQTVNG